MNSGARIVGFADTGLKRSLPNLDWLIVVSQSEREAWFSDADRAYFWTHREEELADLEVLETQRPSPGKAASA
jgi:hypothetical protein